MSINNNHIQPFNAANLCDMDGGAVGAEIDRQLKILCADIADRPMNAMMKATPARKLHIEISLTPMLIQSKQTQTVELEGICAEPVISGGCPKTMGNKTEVRMKKGKLVYNKAVPENFDQLPLQFSEEAADTE